MELIEILGLPPGYYVEANKARNRFTLVLMDFDQKMNIGEFNHQPDTLECLSAIAKQAKEDDRR